MPTSSKLNTTEVLSIPIGRWGVASAPVCIRTLLGSCVGIVLHDLAAHIGGVAHIVLPKSNGEADHPGKFADTAIPAMILDLDRLRGRKVTRGLTAKIVGGASMFQAGAALNIGRRNSESVEKILADLGIPILGAMSGGGGASFEPRHFNRSRLDPHSRRTGLHDIIPVDATFTNAASRTMKRLLVVDDALLMRKLIRDVAVEAGWEVAGEAANGREAVELYRQLRPDLVTMDVVMPELSGLEALRQIRAADPEARVVMVTALDQKQTLVESIRDGAMDFVVKPFDRQRIAGLLAKVGSRLDAAQLGTEAGKPPTREGP